jgi:hypothetical protein
MPNTDPGISIVEVACGAELRKIPTTSALPLCLSESATSEPSSRQAATDVKRLQHEPVLTATSASTIPEH